MSCVFTARGAELTRQLAGELLSDAATPDLHLILCDIVEPKAPKAADPSKVITRKADLTNPAAIQELYTTEFGVPDTIYCFHGIMSRGSEDNFDLGLKVGAYVPLSIPDSIPRSRFAHSVQVNIDSMRYMLDAARHAQAPQPIRFIFTSSLAVYGGPTPDIVKPETIATPEGAYGTGKLISEMMVNEYTRRGYVDGVILRLPTIVVRPGVPSAATSAFLSGVIREPLHGVEALCPIGNSLEDPALSLAAWVASPEVTIRNFVIAKHVPSEKFMKHSRVVYLPGFTTTVKEEIEALATVAGKEALKLISFKVGRDSWRLEGG